MLWERKWFSISCHLAHERLCFIRGYWYTYTRTRNRILQRTQCCILLGFQGWSKTDVEFRFRKRMSCTNSMCYLFLLAHHSREPARGNSSHSLSESTIRHRTWSSTCFLLAAKGGCQQAAKSQANTGHMHSVVQTEAPPHTHTHRHTQYTALLLKALLCRI